jgi:hypothetical protein
MKVKEERGKAPTKRAPRRFYEPLQDIYYARRREALRQRFLGVAEDVAEILRAAPSGNLRQALVEFSDALDRVICAVEEEA